MKLSYRTRGDAPVNGKQLIFVHTMSLDAYFIDRIVNMILDGEGGNNYAVIFTESDGFAVDFDSYELSRINLYVPFITDHYLQECPNDFSFEALQREKGIMVLPIVDHSELMPAYDARFSNTHAITLDMKDPRLEIEKQLSRMLISADLNSEIIKDAFTRKLFISYRKKDKDQIEKIMKAVRGTRWAASAAFWFDDFLVPGTDFEDGINDAMGESNAIVMAVTPNLPAPNAEGKRNYVCEHEYPDAVKMGKPIIAVEALPTERSELEEQLPGFPECVPVDDEVGLDRAFGQLGDEEPEVDPHITYLRAMAFLTGVRVEKDAFRAWRMLDDCVDLCVPEAALQLSYMHCFGVSTYEDLRQAILYKQRAFEIVDGWPESMDKLQWMYRILFNEGKDPDCNIGLNNDEADIYYQRFLDTIEHYEDNVDLHPEEVDRLTRWKVECHIQLGNVEERSDAEIRSLGKQHFVEHFDAAEKLLDRCSEQGLEFHRVSGVYNSIRSSLCREEEDYPRAELYASRAVRDQQDVVGKDPTFEARWQLATYKMNQLGCNWILFLQNPPQNRDVIPVHLDRYQGRAREYIDAYEKLYAEKRQPRLACELIEAYRNLMRFAKNGKERKAYWKEAAQRYDEVLNDYPNDGQLRGIAMELDQDVHAGNPLTMLATASGPSLPAFDGLEGVLPGIAMLVHVLLLAAVAIYSERIAGGTTLSALPSTIMIVGGALLFDPRKTWPHIVGDILVLGALSGILWFVTNNVMALPVSVASLLYVVFAVASTIL